MPNPIITRKVADANRLAYDQYLTRFASLLAEGIKPGMHGEVGLTVKIRDGKIVGADETFRRSHLMPKEDAMRRAA